MDEADEAEDTRPWQPGTTSRWSWYRGLGSPSRVLAPMVDQSEPQHGQGAGRPAGATAHCPGRLGRTASGPGCDAFRSQWQRKRRASAAQVTVAAHGAAAAYRVLSSAQRVPPSPISLPLTVQEPAFRELCRRHGCDLAYTPMFNARIFADQGGGAFTPGEGTGSDRPLVVQFAGHDPASLEP